MTSAVTINGSSDQAITLNFDTTANFALAKQIAAGINTGIAAGTIVTAFDSNRPPPPLPASVTGALVQTEVPLAVLPHGYTIGLVTKSGPALLFGNGTPDEKILSDAKTDLTFIATAGSGTVVAGGGANRLIVGGSGDWSLNTGSGTDIISALGSGNATISAGGGHNAILLGSGDDVIVSQGDDSISGGSGAETIDASGAHSDFVQGNASHLLFVGGLGGATILGGTGSDTYLGSAADPLTKQIVVGGSAGHNFLFAGDGAATLTGGGNQDQLFAFGGSAQLLVAGTGNETLSAALSSGNDTLKAGSGRDLLIGGSGSDTFVGSSGHTTVVAGSGSQMFAFVNHEAGGIELVQGIFDPASIQISLQGYGRNAIDRALDHQTTNNGSVTIGLTDDTKVTFADVTSLSRSNFV